MNASDEKSPDNDLQVDNLPNRLTTFRIVLIPFIIGLLHATQYPPFENRDYFNWIATVLFALASFTDFLDGYIARKKGLITVFGSFFDPIADKFLVISSLILLQSLNRVIVLVVLVLVLREIYILSLRLLAMHEGISVPVSNMGKWKTAIQMIGIGCVMSDLSLPYLPAKEIGSYLLYTACFLAIWSATTYSFNTIRKLKTKRRSKKNVKTVPN